MHTESYEAFIESMQVLVSGAFEPMLMRVHKYLHDAPVVLVNILEHKLTEFPSALLSFFCSFLQKMIVLILPPRCGPILENFHIRK